jgi:hypothetical protein
LVADRDQQIEHPLFAIRVQMVLQVPGLVESTHFVVVEQFSRHRRRCR